MAVDGIKLSQVDIEDTLNRIKGYKNVSGIIVAEKDGTSLRSTFDRKTTLKYCTFYVPLVARAMTAFSDIEAQDEMRLVRLRSKKKEVVLAPHGNYVLMVVRALSGAGTDDAS